MFHTLKINEYHHLVVTKTSPTGVSGTQPHQKTSRTRVIQYGVPKIRSKVIRARSSSIRGDSKPVPLSLLAGYW